jgi:hypothetical protein
MLGVKHPTHPNTKEPIIMTTDQLLTIDSTQGISYHAISIKPESESNKQRVLEKIDIERVCWELLGVKFSYFTGNELTRIQSRNLDWASAPFRENPTRFSDEQISSALTIINVGQVFFEDLCNKLISMNIATHDDSQLLIRYLIADKYIDVDLSSNIPELGIMDVKSIAVMGKGAMNGTS